MSNNNTLDAVKLAAQAIYEKKGLNLLILDVTGLSTITDYLIVAEGHVDRHVTALGSHVVSALRDLGERPIHAEGMDTGQWVAIDYLDYIVHIFGPGIREFYALERIWPMAKIVDFQFSEQATTA